MPTSSSRGGSTDLYRSLPPSTTPARAPRSRSRSTTGSCDQWSAMVEEHKWLKRQRNPDRGHVPWRFYELFAWVVMANHVHVLLRPLIPLHKALMNIKSGSARAANAALGRTGKPFWQDESFDHWVRNDSERSSIIRYIHTNPFTPGLFFEPEKWPWSKGGGGTHGPPPIIHPTT